VDLNLEIAKTDNLSQLFYPGAPDFGDARLFSILTAALGEKDVATQLHARRVAGYTERLARRVGFTPKEVQELAMGGMLHDLGKLALSDQVLSHRKTELTAEMWGEVYSHPLIGGALIERSYGKGTIHDAVLYHHERLDGSGYPFGLKGDQIPMGAQMVSVTDCFDAITTDRPYQKRKSHAQAFQILNNMAGSFLNDDLVAVFIEDIRNLGVISCFGRHASTNIRTAVL
jgi:HD-GYP domain-containing protein (c-di-GMP phosphodiesterase class II)